MSDSIERAVFEHEGEQFVVNHYHDSDADAPWENSDCHGPVRASRYCLPTRKRAGEWILYQDGHGATLYDAAEAQRIAIRDGWGHGDPVPNESERQRAARAVRADFEYLRGWCNDEWSYIGIEVRHVATGETASLWRVDGPGSYPSAGAYHKEVRTDLARQIMAGDAFAHWREHVIVMGHVPALVSALRTMAETGDTGAEILTLRASADALEILSKGIE